MSHSLSTSVTTSTTKLNLLGKAVYTAGFLCGTTTKVAKATASIVKSDYNNYLSTIKTL